MLTLFRASVAAVLMIGAAIAPAKASRFSTYVEGLWPEASAAGVSRATFDAAFAGVTPDETIIKLSGTQPEFNQTIWAYINDRVSRTRIDVGRSMAAKWKPWLDKIEQRYGVDRYTVLAVWGLETNYGSFKGKQNIIRSLATLACCTAKRPDFFRKELVIALQILEAHDTDPRHMTGSWAGAMGHTQFMPSSFMAYAVDATGDGRRDIWDSIPDALASTANYLKGHGWQDMKTWGCEVKLPAGFDYAAIDTKAGSPLSEWARLGVTRISGQPFPRGEDAATLHLPAGARGPAFLTLANYDAIKTYNNSDSYALSVGHLADRIRGGSGFVAAWPNDKALTRKQREGMQRRLQALGYGIEKIDGKIGAKSRAAYRQWQASIGLVPDGYATVPQLRQLGVVD